MRILMIIMTIINVVILLCNIRLIFYALTGLPKAGIIYPEAEKKHHFAILIPARNEESCIGRLLDSLADMDYPEHLKEVFVVINGCTDRTEEIAREHGAAIIKCGSDVRDKAGALRTAFDSLAGRTDIDAYAVFDADTAADTAYLAELNKAFAQDRHVLQGKRQGLGISRTWVAQSYEIYYAMHNALFNHPRTRRDLSASINGSGWAVSREIIERDGFDLCTLAEDIEYTVLTAVRGETITYCDKAVIYDEFVCDIHRSMKQRLRWSKGNTQCLLRYAGQLIKQARVWFKTMRREALTCIDMLMVNMIPVFAALTILSLAVPVVCALIMTALGALPAKAAVSMLVMCLLAWLASSFMSLVVLLKTHINPGRCLKGIFLFQLFLVTWVPLVIISFFRREVRWVEMRK